MSTNFIRTPVPNFTKVRPTFLELLRMDKGTDMTNIIGAFFKFCYERTITDIVQRVEPLLGSDHQTNRFPRQRVHA
jgi:hypothetical protein